MYYIPKLLKKLKTSSIKNSKFAKDSKCESNCLIVNSSFSNHSYCGYDCKILNTEIGKYTSIADNVSIGIQNHRTDLFTTSPCFIKGKDSVHFRACNLEPKQISKTIIGNDVWIGEHTLIKAGISIGDGAIVGMGSIVTKDIPPYAVVGGNPAQVIKYRFDKNIVEELLKIKWWNLDDSLLKENNGFNGDTNTLIKWCKSNNK